jgi:hypothetical protein
MKQQGHVFKASGSWYVKYREDAIENGQLVRKLRTHRLALEDDMCRTMSDAKNLAEEFLAPLNRNALTAESTVSVRDFTEKTYLPFVKESKRASTYKGYRDIWNVHIGPRMGKLRMRNVNTPVIYLTLRSIAFERDLTTTTLGHIKAMLSGLFRHAINVAHTRVAILYVTRSCQKEGRANRRRSIHSPKFPERWQAWTICCSSQWWQSRPTLA